MVFDPKTGHYDVPCEQVCIRCELTQLRHVSREDAMDIQVFVLQLVHGLKIGDWRQARKWRDALTRKLRKMSR